MPDSMFCKRCGEQRQSELQSVEDIATMSAAYHGSKPRTGSQSPRRSTDCKGELLGGTAPAGTAPAMVSQDAPQQLRRSESRCSSASRLAGTAPSAVSQDLPQHRPQSSQIDSMDGRPAGEDVPESVQSEAFSVAGDSMCDATQEALATDLVDGFFGTAFGDILETVAGADMSAVDEEAKWREAVVVATAAADRRAREDSRVREEELQARLAEERSLVEEWSAKAAEADAQRMRAEDELEAATLVRLAAERRNAQSAVFKVSEFMVHKVKMETKLKRASAAHEEETVKVRSEARKRTIAEAQGAKLQAEADEMEICQRSGGKLSKEVRKIHEETILEAVRKSEAEAVEAAAAATKAIKHEAAAAVEAVRESARMDTMRLREQESSELAALRAENDKLRKLLANAPEAAAAAVLTRQTAKKLTRTVMTGAYRSFDFASERKAQAERQAAEHAARLAAADAARQAAENERIRNPQAFVEQRLAEEADVAQGSEQEWKLAQKEAEAGRNRAARISAANKKYEERELRRESKRWEARNSIVQGHLGGRLSSDLANALGKRKDFEPVRLQTRQMVSSAALDGTLLDAIRMAFVENAPKICLRASAKERMSYRRPTQKMATRGEACPCGNIFMTDAVFCRKCGKKKGEDTPAVVKRPGKDTHAGQALMRGLKTGEVARLVGVMDGGGGTAALAHGGVGKALANEALRQPSQSVLPEARRGTLNRGTPTSALAKVRQDSSAAPVLAAPVVDVQALRESARHVFIQANSEGTLDGAIAEINHTTPRTVIAQSSNAAPKALNTQALRFSAMNLVLAASQDGSLTSLLTEVRAEAASGQSALEKDEAALESKARAVQGLASAAASATSINPVAAAGLVMMAAGVAESQPAAASASPAAVLAKLALVAARNGHPSAAGLTQAAVAIARDAV